MIKQLKKILKQLPHAPGVYRFLNAQKKIIYVGKAAVLKDRVRSYFRSSADLSPAKQRMVAEVVDINIIQTDSEIEALLLEANLIKKFQPYYNVTLRDDKSYIYVKVSTEEEWPRVFATRKIDKTGTYFGPFTSANAVREVLRVLRKFLPYRCNQKVIESKNHRIIESRSKPPLAPPLQGGEGGGYRACPVRSSPPYRPSGRASAGGTSNGACFWYHIGRCPGTCIGAITQKDYRKTIRRILLFFEGRMDELTRAMKKELGPDRVTLMENVLAHTRVLSVGEQYAGDVKELARALHLAKPPERIEGYDISNIMGREATGSMVVFTNGEPDKSEYKRFKIKTIKGANDVGMLEEVLTRRLLHAPMSLRGSTSDRSNPQEIAALRQGGARNDRNDQWPSPDLMIIDGGKAQLNVVLRVLKNKYLQKVPIGTKSKFLIPVIAVAKGGHGGVLRQKEEIYFPGERTPLKLPNNSPALHLILRVRDEAHRFAIGYHTALRRKKFLGGIS